MIQRTHERVRRIELQLGVRPSHYEALSDETPAPPASETAAPPRAAFPPPGAQAPPIPGSPVEADP
jgi:hypothetical protein